MAEPTTTMKVSVRNRDVLRRFADEDGLTRDEALGRILRRERQRRMGSQLAAGLTPDERAVIRGGTRAVGKLLDTVESCASRARHWLTGAALQARKRRTPPGRAASEGAVLVEPRLNPVAWWELASFVDLLSCRHDS